MTKTVHGKVHDRTIELDEDLGVIDGQELEVQVTMLKPKKKLPGPPPGWRPGSTESAAGMMAEHWTEEDDRIRGDRARSPSAFDAGAARASFLLDTNILSRHLQRPAGLAYRFF